MTGLKVAMADAQHLIRSDADYAAALTVYEAFFDRAPEPGSVEGDRFERLGLMLAKYEDETAPIITTRALPR